MQTTVESPSRRWCAAVTAAHWAWAFLWGRGDLETVVLFRRGIAPVPTPKTVQSSDRCGNFSCRERNPEKRGSSCRLKFVVLLVEL